ncbi:MAG TPA: protein phosphatase 2C domain-containing protein [Thermomicrobiales bacterium]|nr:protein phosphatase 2C domain-containing protein [Thermomicrobiales bacterium]
MHASTRAFWLPKAGNTADEYEDAFWVEPAGKQPDDVVRLAVADGATETSFAGLWAALLARDFCQGRLDGAALPDALAPLQGAWREYVATRPLPWYAEEKVRQGAFSSLLGLTVTNGAAAGGDWEALAIGDSCLFQVRDGDLLGAFPLTGAAEFTSRPALLSSDPARNAVLPEHLVSAVGDWETGDSFYLMTDALACWFLAAAEAGDRPWLTLRDLDPTGLARSFADWVAAERAAGRLRNDDVTLLWVDLAAN